MKDKQINIEMPFSEEEILAKTMELVKVVMPKIKELWVNEKILAFADCEIGGSLSFLLVKLHDDGSLSSCDNKITLDQLLQLK